MKNGIRLLVVVIGWGFSAYGCMENCTMRHYCFLLGKAVGQQSLDNPYMKGLTAIREHINAPDCRGNTLLHYCVWHKDVTVEFVDRLLKLGAQLDIKNNEGHSVMFYHRFISMSPLDTPDEGLIQVWPMPKRDVMDFLFATEVSRRLTEVIWQRDMQDKQELWSKVSCFR